MTNKLTELETWFDNYVENFKTSDGEVRKNIDLKILHTKKVYQNIIHLSKKLQLQEEKKQTAGIAALLHDIGRFEQFSRYKTFADKLSVDHAELGLEIIEEEKILKNFPADVSQIVITAIKFHNKLAVPQHLTEEEKFFTRLLRDADKLDIFRVVIEYYDQLKNNRSDNHAVVLGLPDNNGYSAEVVDDILKGEIVKSQDLKTVNDFRLLQMAWIFDINFVPTFQIIAENQFLEKIYDHLPKTTKIHQAYTIIQNHLNNNCKKPLNSVLF